MRRDYRPALFIIASLEVVLFLPGDMVRIERIVKKNTIISNTVEQLLPDTVMITIITTEKVLFDLDCWK